MKITKKRLGDLDRCYCASHMITKDGPKVILASEAYVDEGRPCYAYSGKDFDKTETLWENGGGCMSILQIPGKDNEVLAIYDFYLKETPSRSKIMWGIFKDNKWNFKDLLHMQYIHRFAIATIDGNNYLIYATIADEKEHKEDWRVPGSIYAAKLPEDLNNAKLDLKQIKTGLFRNHGFYHDKREGHNEIYFGSDQGIDKLYLKGEIDEWKFERIIDVPVGEIAIGDLDNDGIDEVITIEPFHGDKIRIYDQKNKKLNKVFEYENKIDFAHALISTTFRGEKTFVCGVRRVEAELFYIQYKDGKYQYEIIEKEVGPANLDVINLEDKDVIISANHSKNEAAIYIVED